MAEIESIQDAATTQAATDWDALSPDDFADKLIADLDSKGPLLTCDDMDKLERLWEEERRGRRCALVLMTKPFSWVREQVETDRDFAAAVAACYSYTRENELYKGTAALIEQANLWAMIALAGREDMNELLAEAEATSG